MYSSIVWDFVEAPKKIESIRCKWIYKRKIGLDGKVKSFMPSIIARSYNSKLVFDYGKPFLR